MDWVTYNNVIFAAGSWGNVLCFIVGWAICG